MTSIGEAKSIGTNTNLAYVYETPQRQIMTQADFLREHDVNAHKINSLKYYPNALLKDEGGKVMQRLNHACSCLPREDSY